MLATEVGDGLVTRGVDAVTAQLVSQLTVTVLYVSLARWYKTNGESLAAIVHDTLGRLSALPTP